MVLKIRSTLYMYMCLYIDTYCVIFLLTLCYIPFLWVLWRSRVQNPTNKLDGETRWLEERFQGASGDSTVAGDNGGGGWLLVPHR